MFSVMLPLPMLLLLTLCAMNKMKARRGALSSAAQVGVGPRDSKHNKLARTRRRDGGRESQRGVFST